MSKKSNAKKAESQPTKGIEPKINPEESKKPEESIKHRPQDHSAINPPIPANPEAKVEADSQEKYKYIFLALIVIGLIGVRLAMSQWV